MNLIGILLALLAEKAIGHVPGFGRPALLRLLIVNVQQRVPLPGYWRSAAAPAVFLALGAGVIALLDWWLQHPLLDLLFGAVMLFLCLDSRDLSDDIHQLIAAREKNDEAAERKLKVALLRSPERLASRRSLVGTLFIQSHERLFGVLLWFIAAGPAGAVLYRIASGMPRFLHETQPGSAAERAGVWLHAVAAWIPARLTAALFGLAGSLDLALTEWRRQLTAHNASWRERTWALLAEVSAASLAVDEGEAGTVVPATLDGCLREVLAIRARALLILLAAYGLFTMGGWIA
ncbi:MAG: regulatory signaling modulator protein AmpE [Hydrocarboniphaga effusa]|nr:regulatory signaling modulator protein AmpE [Hydrocarboniphaga effusa]